ncbi:MAG: OB-fold-containig protein [Planktomarina sp.]
MLDTLLSPEFAPFTLALALLFALVALEVLFMLIGLSLVGDAGDIDLDVDVPDMGDLADIGIDIDLPDAADYDIPDMAEGADAADALETDPGALAWLGLGKVPFMIWLGAVLLGFGATGIVIQSVASNLFVLPWTVVALPAIVAAIWFAKTFAAGFSAVLPKSETSAMSTNRFGGYRGTVTQGTARRGHPAEVRITDRFGNNHYLRAEPAKDDDEISQGTDVILLRNIRTKQMRLLPVG